MRRFAPSSVLFAAAAACTTQAAEPVRVDLELSGLACEREAGCGRRVGTQGVVARVADLAMDGEPAAPGALVLYADFPLGGGALAMLRIVTHPQAPTVIRYREAIGGSVVFDGTVTDVDVALEGPPTFHARGHFSFTATDGPEVRKIENGRVTTSVPVDRAPSSPPSTVEPTTVVVLPPPVPSEPNPPRPPDRPSPDVSRDDSGGCGQSEPWEPDPPDPDDGDTGSGCDEYEPTDPSPSDPALSDSGCEGDTIDSDPSPDYASGGGCDGDSGSSDAAVNSCEGDTVDAAPRPRSRSRALAGMWRLGWPMLLVGGINRCVSRRRRNGGRGPARRPSRPTGRATSGAADRR